MFLPFRRSPGEKLVPFAAEPRATGARGAAALRRRFLVEPLEGRQMLSTTFTVTSTADTTAMGTLRWAITQSNETTGPNTINFDITDPTGCLLEIELASPLPAVTNPVNINGLSQPGSSGTSPLIQIDGTGAGSGAVGITIDKSASGTATTPTLVSGLEITDFAAGGVYVNDASYIDLNALFVGVQAEGYEPGTTGTYVSEANTNYGVEFSQGTSDMLSSSDVSANQGPGVIVSDTSHAQLSGNFIGTDITASTVARQQRRRRLDRVRRNQHHGDRYGH